ncbi:SRPBCC family protein [Brachybacterium sp. GCM10030252]|uniref:SRPBCC family protein n=1 Tax=Brachybacterium sp. GCM10030252 TaxID=3273380 RepID=UPI003620A7A0
MNATPQPNGQLGEGPHGREVRIERRFRAPIDDVWAAMTEPERLQRWIGRWEGDPATGRVAFFMTAEGDDVEPEEFAITECSPPHRFAADTSVGDGAWHLRFELSHEDGITTVVFAQALGDDPLGSVGPGWEYYLDRLARTLEGEDADDVDWHSYYPSMSEYYESLAR